MFINIEDDMIILTDSIILILNYSLFSSSTEMNNLLMSEKVIKTLKKPKSVIITTELIYFSSIPVDALKRRLDFK